MITNVKNLIEELGDKQIELAAKIQGSEYDWDANSTMFVYQEKIEIIDEIKELLEEVKDKMEEIGE